MDRRGPYEFFARQYSEYLPRVLNYMRLRTDDEALAQDLTAHTFERALTRLSTLHDEGAFAGWLFAIARSVIASHYRRHKPLLPLEHAEGEPDPGPSVEGQLVQRDELDAMRRALAVLSDREGEIIRLRFVAGLGNREIAQSMSLSEGNVAVILYRALRKVRAQMEQEGR